MNESLFARRVLSIFWNGLFTQYYVKRKRNLRMGVWEGRFEQDVWEL